MKAARNTRNKHSEDLKLKGSQLNLSQRQESPRYSNTLSHRPNVARRCTHRRPMSADLPDLSRTPRSGVCHTHSLCNHAVKPFWSGSQPHLSAGSRNCTASRRCRLELDDVDFIPGREDPFRHAYTAQSAQLLQTLLREPWSSEDSSLGGETKDKEEDPKHTGKKHSENDKTGKDMEVDLKFERWFPGEKRKDVRFELTDSQVKKTSQNVKNNNEGDENSLVDFLSYEENGDGNLSENQANDNMLGNNNRLHVDLSWLEPEVMERRTKMASSGDLMHNWCGSTSHIRDTVQGDEKSKYGGYYRCCEHDKKATDCWVDCQRSNREVRGKNSEKYISLRNMCPGKDGFTDGNIGLLNDGVKYSNRSLDHMENSEIGSHNMLRSSKNNIADSLTGSTDTNSGKDAENKEKDTESSYLPSDSNASGRGTNGNITDLRSNKSNNKFDILNGREAHVNLSSRFESEIVDNQANNNLHSIEFRDNNLESKEKIEQNEGDDSESVEKVKISKNKEGAMVFSKNLKICDNIEAGVNENVDARNTTGSCRKSGEGGSNKATPRDSTYEDLVSILNVLEGDETQPLLGAVQPSPVLEGSAGRQVNEIFNYLDQVERCSDPGAVKPVLRPSAPSTALPMALLTSSIPRLDELLCRNTVDLAQEVLSLRLQAEEQANGLKLLQQTIADVKASEQQAKAAWRAETEKAGDEAEIALIRHQQMVQKLLAEKKKLNEKISSLVGEMKSTEERHQRNLKTMEERHLVDLQRVKETQAAAEKLKREKWIDVKTQKIKEMTVKGLEPELSRMAARQQQELTELRALHRAELEAVELRAARRNTELMDQLRVEMTKDKEEALQREAALLRTRWEKQLEEEQRRSEEQVRRLKDENRRDRDRLAMVEVQFQETLAEARRSMDREKEREKAAVARELEEKLEDVQRQHQVELKDLKESMVLEKEMWMNNYKRIQANKFLEREAELHYQYKKERDRDLELAIDRLETEGHKAKLELQEAAENRLKRLREKLEGELKDTETEVTSLKAKLSDSKLLLVAKEDRVADLETELRHNKTELVQLKKLCEEMSAERVELRKVVGAELEAELSSAAETVEVVRQEMATLKANHVVQLERRDEAVRAAKKEAEKDLQDVGNRVRLTIMKKDEAMDALREQYKVALERCSHLEQMLDNQRRNLLLK